MTARSAKRAAIGIGCAAALVLIGLAQPTQPVAPTPLTEIASVLDAFHHAASDASFEQYFDQMASDGVFLGTDATERWTKPQFQAYAKPYFDAGTGWTYVPRDRHIAVSDTGEVAWFDELLDNEKYGEARGTGVLVLEGNAWKISQYSLSFPIPNDIAGSVVEQIAAWKAEHGG